MLFVGHDVIEVQMMMMMMTWLLLSSSERDVARSPSIGNNKCEMKEEARASCR